jgi:hypothetical protein
VFVLSCVQVAALQRVDHSSKGTCRLGKEIEKMKSGRGPRKSYKPEGHGFESQMSCILFNIPNYSSHTKALGLTQSLTDMSTKDLPGGNKRPARRANKLAVICEPND